MNDFERIKVPKSEGAWDTRKLMVEDVYKLHQEAVAYIKLALDTPLPCVLFTHHAPTYLACNRKRFPDGRMDDAYASNLTQLILDHPNLKIAAHGHSHYRYRARIGETIVTANSRGYYCYVRAAISFEFI
jgi:hypothetical protein